MRKGYLVVEGPHDVEFVARILKSHGVRRIQTMSLLDPYWHPLVPRSFPPGDDLRKRVPVPMFFESQNVSIAIHAAEGDARVASTVDGTRASLRGGALDALGAILDADSNDPPEERFQKVRSALAKQGLSLPDKPGEVSTNSTPRCGVFVLPDNQNPGTLEDLLLECASRNYPGLLGEAQALVAKVNPSSPEFQKSELVELLKPAGRNKATVALISNILKPGKAVQTSIQDNRWVDGATLALPRIDAVQRFLVDLLGPF